MTGAALASARETADAGAPQPQPPRRARTGRRALAGVAALLLLVVGLLAGVRFGAATDPGRALILRAINGMPLGPVGRLRVEGLSGDVWTRFGLRRLAIVDGRGPWLEARDLQLAWRPFELVRRRVHVERLRAGALVILRRPLVEARPKRPPSEAPVSVALDDFAGRIETRPAFSSVPGAWDVRGAVDYSRQGRATGRLRGDSRLHAGDGVQLAFVIGDKRLHLDGSAVEGRGGALAGALGLPPDQRFVVEAHADGTDRGGAFRFDAHSGDAQPASAEGNWTPEGGRLDAQVKLSASRLTQWFAQRVGPQMRLTIGGRRRPDGLYDIAAMARGEAASAVASGPVDVKTRTTPGLRLDLAVDRLASWVSEVDLGPTQAHGLFTGDLGRFTYKGRLAGERFMRDGYVLARLEGPAELARDKEGWRWSGDLAGAGGGGAGPLLPLLGAKPTLQTSGAFLADHRVLIRDLHLAGANLRLDATGGRGLFGDLSFKGGAQILSLAGVHPGAHGGADASWTAAQGKGEHGWRFGLDARGRGFASGLPELDRLLGPAPRVSATGVFADGVFTIARGDLAGVAAQATARGRYGQGNALDLAVDWRAQGPFAAGPVEVAGQIKGAGHVGGTLSAPQADLTGELASLDLGRLMIRPARFTLSFVKSGDDLAGRATLAGASAEGEAQAHANFRFVPKGVDLSDVLTQAGGVRLAGGLALRNGQPSSADLQLAAGPGAFLSSGRLAGAVKLVARPDGGASADVRLQGADLSAPGGPGRLRTLQLSAVGPLERLPLRLSAEADQPLAASFSGTGVLAQLGSGPALARELSLTGAGKVRGAAYRTLEPARLRLGPDGRSARLQLAVGGGRLWLDGRQGADGDLHAEARADSVSLAALIDDYAGALSGGLRLDGRGARLAGVLDARLADARTSDAPANLALNATLHAALDNARLRVQASATNRQGLRAQTNLDLPAEAAADPFRLALVRTRPLRGDFSAEGELRPLWDLLAGGERSLSGRVVARGTVGGTLDNPASTGVITLADGRFADSSTGLVLDKLDAQAELGPNRVDVRRFTGTDGRNGTLGGSGVVSLARDGDSTFQISLKRFQLIDNDLGRATASGAVTVVRDAQGRARVVGRLGVDRADITTKTPTPTGVIPMEVEEINLPARPGAPERAAPRPSGSGLVALDVSITAPRGVFVRGKGVDAELSLVAHVGGTTARPDLSGTARIVRGSYDFSGKRFDLDESGTVRLASHPDDIRLDLKAERDDPALDAVVHIRGTASRPEITLSSQPVLPQDEILSRVLFGVSASQLSGFEAAQLVTALGGLTTGGGFDILANLRQFAGLDRLALGGDSAGATISGGKYLTNNIYLELTGAAQGRSQTATTAAQQARTGPSAQVEWRVRRDLSLVSQAWTGGDARLSVRFRRSY